MKKKVLTIFLTALVFLSTAFLGVATVFRLEGVSVEVTLLSETSKTEAQALQEKLLARYEGESIFNADRRKADEELVAYPYFRMTAFEKEYPNKLKISLIEDDETYAVEKADGGYYIVSGEGVVVEERTVNTNRLDDGENILVKGVEVTGEKGGTLAGDAAWQSLLSVCQSFEKELGSIRLSVRSVEVWKKTPEFFLLITMKEGVKIYLENPASLTSEKAIKAVDAYLSLSNDEKIGGRIALLEVDGEVFAEYKATDDFTG